MAKMISAIAKNPKTIQRSELRNVPVSIAQEWAKSIALPPYEMTDQTFYVSDEIRQFKSWSDLQDFLKSNV